MEKLNIKKLLKAMHNNVCGFFVYKSLQKIYE